MLGPGRAAIFARRRVAAWRNIRLWQRQDRPILVHSKPKSGTTTVESAIERAGLRVLKTHRLNDPDQKQTVRYRAQHVPFPYHWHVEQVVGGKLSDPDRPPVRVISLLRDPIKRAVSTRFQNLALRQLDTLSAADLAERIRADIMNGSPARGWRTWIRRELEETLGFDILSAEFDREAGAQIYEAGDDRLLFMVLERLADQADRLSSFVGCEIAIGHRNARDATADAGKYTEVMAQLRFPDAMLDGVYGSDIMQKFYTSDQRDRMRDTWRG